MTSDSAYILIAEDDEDDQFLMRLAFTEADRDVRIEFVDNGIELLNYFGKIEEGSVKDFPALLIVDLNMPRKNGQEALKELCLKNYFSKIPVIVFSTTGNELERIRCREIGVENYFVKPADFRQLVNMASRFVNIAGLHA